MATGFQVGKECYSTLSKAEDAYFSAQPMLMANNNGSYGYVIIHYPIKDAVNGWINQYLQVNPAGGSTIATGTTGIIPRNFPSCTINDPINNFSDGALMGWGVLTAMAVAWGIKQMGRAI